MQSFYRFRFDQSKDFMVGIDSRMYRSLYTTKPHTFSVR